MTEHQDEPDMNESLPGCSEQEAFDRIHLVPENRRGDVLALLLEVGQGDFWEKKRYVQVVRLLDRKDDYRVLQTDIAKIVDLSDNIVSRYKRYHHLHPEEERRLSGRPSEIRDVFELLERFVDERNQADKPVTMDVLMDYATNHLHITVSRKVLWEYMVDHGFVYKLGTSRDRLRVITKEREVEKFYNDLANDLQGVNPSPVFNVDEMGVELYADRNDVMVFVRPEQLPPNGNLLIGVPRSSRRCTPIACIGLDGDTLKPTILTKTKTVNSFIFERDYSPSTVKILSTEKGFVTTAIFKIWLRDVFLKAVEAKRTELRGLIGDFDDRAVLILDGCSAHFSAQILQLLEANRVKMVFLVPHTSHLTQPLDLGIFGQVKSIIRSNASYVTNLHNIDQAVADENAARNERREPSAEPGKKLADFIITILQAFHKATTPPRVVSAFEQAGICSRFAPGDDLNQREAFVDPTRARLVMEETGLFRDRVPVPDARHRQIKILDLNSEDQSEIESDERQRPERRPERRPARRRARRAARRVDRPTPNGHHPLPLTYSPGPP